VLAGISGPKLKDEIMIKQKIEVLLFIIAKPLSLREIVKALKKNSLEKQEALIGERDQPSSAVASAGGQDEYSARQVVTEESVKAELEELKTKYNSSESGIRLVEVNDEYQLVTNPELADFVKHFVKDELTGELTPASLETLTVIAYRGPISKPVLEQIRGVNCSLIIRNLLIRGLISVEADTVKMSESYSVTVDFFRYLGLNSVTELPEYAKLHTAENLEGYLEGHELTNGHESANLIS